MADNYLITGYWGEPHVTSENDRGINAAVFGTGRFVLPVGEQFRAEYIGNNTVRMYDGKLLDNGAAAGIPAGEYIDLLIANAGQGMNRNDLIVFQYAQDSSTLVESGRFVVVQGAETSGSPTDPTLTQEDLLSGEAVMDQMALWRVSVSGTTISAPVKLFDVSTALADKAEGGHTHTLKSLGAASETEMHRRDRVVNLLDNSDFTHPVNQRGKTSYTGPNDCIDRWKQATGSATVSVADGGLTLTSSAESCWMHQPLAKQLAAGIKYTLYIEFPDGEKYACVIEATTSNIFVRYNYRVVLALSRNDFAIIVDPGNSVTVKYAALYEGEYTTENVPSYMPKGYAHELAECQRYYWPMDSEYVGYGYGDGYGQIIVDIILPIEMRVNPTVAYTYRLAHGDEDITNSVTNVYVTATTKKVRFAIVTLNAGLKNQLMRAVINDVKLDAGL